MSMQHPRASGTRAFRGPTPKAQARHPRPATVLAEPDPAANAEGPELNTDDEPAEARPEPAEDAPEPKQLKNQRQTLAHCCFSQVFVEGRVTHSSGSFLHAFGTARVGHLSGSLVGHLFFALSGSLLRYATELEKD